VHINYVLGKFDFIVGIDPDSKKHGVAVFNQGELIRLCTMNTPRIVSELIPNLSVHANATKSGILFAIENVLQNDFIYTRNTKSTKAAQSKVALHVGRCQQSLQELMAWLEHLKIPFVLHAPTSRNWHDNKPLFEQRTGWGKPSNDDTRSAAYFGWLELQSQKRAG
jgi:hypothetical protein